MAATIEAGERARSGPELKLIGLIGLAHACSHFYQLVLPPLFPVLRDALGVGYAELGGLMTLFYVASGLSQTPAGFVVDRIGARAVLALGLGLVAGATALCGLAPSFWTLVPLVVLAGIGNSVFHPADYTILTSTVHPSRMGRAYSIHNIGGNLGWAAAPVTVLALAGLFGWRAALVVVGVGGLVIVAVLLLYLDPRRIDPHSVPHGSPSPRATPRPTLEALLARPVVLCLLYFVLLSTAMIGVQTFLPATLAALHGTPVALGSTALTAFLLGAAGGILVGGVLADTTRRLDRVIAIGLLGSALALLAVALLDLPGAAIIAAVGLAGFLMGCTTPSRDMLVRASAPRGATGRVFGFVYTGLDIGSALSPVVVGFLLDSGRPALVFWFIAVMLLGTVMMALVLQGSSRRTD